MALTMEQLEMLDDESDRHIAGQKASTVDADITLGSNGQISLRNKAKEFFQKYAESRVRSGWSRIKDKNTNEIRLVNLTTNEIVFLKDDAPDVEKCIDKDNKVIEEHIKRSTTREKEPEYSMPRYTTKTVEKDGKQVEEKDFIDTRMAEVTLTKQQPADRYADIRFNANGYLFIQPTTEVRGNNLIGLALDGSVIHINGGDRLVKRIETTVAEANAKDESIKMLTKDDWPMHFKLSSIYEDYFKKKGRVAFERHIPGEEEEVEYF